jgi:hypothetical protein
MKKFFVTIAFPNGAQTFFIKPWDTREEADLEASRRAHRAMTDEMAYVSLGYSPRPLMTFGVIEAVDSYDAQDIMEQIATEAVS